MEEIPEDILKIAQKIFSKHSRYEVKTWGNRLSKQYNILVSTEKPLNLDYARPFSNTNDLVRNVPEVSYRAAAEKEEKDKEFEDFAQEAQNLKEIYVEKQTEQKMSHSEREKLKEKQLKIIDYDRPLVIGFLQRKFVNNYYVYKRIMNEFQIRDPDFKPETMLDFGAGLGSASWAGFHQYGKKLQRVAAVEPNSHMRELGRFMSRDLDSEILWADSLSMIPGAGSQRGQFDLIVCGFVLPEIPSAEAREIILDTLLARVKKDGYFILVDYGTPKGYRYINDFRNKIIEMSREDVNLVAPCPHHKKCPLAENPDSWCHFSQLVQKYPKGVFPKHPKERQFANEKFSYLVVKKGKTPRQRFTSEEEVLEKTQDVEKRTYFWDRIVRPNIKQAQHVIVDL